jgi:secretion/DNA translocation related CpaE-like protein
LRRFAEVTRPGGGDIHNQWVIHWFGPRSTLFRSSLDSVSSRCAADAAGAYGTDEGEWTVTESITPGRRAPVAEGPGRPLIITEDEVLLDDLLRLCAAVGAEPEVAFAAPPGTGSWQTAPLVLVGADGTGRVRDLARRAGVLLVGRDLDDQDVWRRAVDIGADHVLFLPDAEAWLVDRIADATEGVGEPALTVAVAGGRGGAGASTLACALALTAARAGRRTMLVDADPLGGGLDVLLGAERTGGLRWPDLAESRGRVNSGALEESLPRSHALSVLSWDRGDTVVIPPQAMRSVLGAARRRGGVVVIDLPRRMDEAVAEALAQTDVGLLVVPAELRAVAAATRVASRMSMVLADLRVVARGPFTPGLDDEEIARLVGLRLAGELPPEPGLLQAQEAGRPPGTAARGPLARFCSAFLAEALPSGGSVAA